MSRLLTLLNAYGLNDMAITSTTFANRPAASAATDKIYYFSDIGGGTLFISNGSVWKPLGRCFLASSAVASATLSGTTTETTFVTVNVPGGLMTANGSLQITCTNSGNNSANSKTLRIRLGGASGTVFLQAGSTTLISQQATAIITNRNAQNSQFGMSAGSAGYGQSSGAGVTGAIDTSADTTLVITGQLQSAGAGEEMTLLRHMVELIIP
ncbi:hypothetical protein [Tautonia plasticadhaerens]|uniref:Uncharacterized protein n=1 Tax=Tautonia plasticadhaerens TaxID=2527974 RepID=A0A518H239_9BACT|nr:hypothetical protein [Tautonia plasticadhaerens]QDV34908.1 hypothetical protein ElP_28050 [Tautonia plasticadhaerens]